MFKKQFICTIFILAFSSVLMLENALFVSAKAYDTSYGFSEGSGSESDPYVISTSEELAFFAESVNDGKTYENEYVRLGCDIFVNDESFVFESDSGLVRVSDSENTAWIGTGICGDDSGENEVFDTLASEIGVFYTSDRSADIGTYDGQLEKHTPIGKSTRLFSGVFDGNGHIVSGIYCNESNKFGVGLFGYASSAQIKNVTVENSYIYGNYFVGAIGGSLTLSDVSSCAVNALVFAQSNVGGVAGHLSDTSASQCYNSGIVSGNEKVGGIVGVSLGSVRDSYNVGNVYASSLAGGIVGQNLGKISTSYNAARITGGDDIGAIAGYTKYVPEHAFYIVGSVNNGDGLTDSQMRDRSSYYGFDFEDVWTLDHESAYPYPTLISVKHITEEHTHIYTSECDKTCSGCDFIREITHSFGSELQSDSGAHYYVCETCGELGSVSSHKYDNACDSICNVCSYDRNVYHEFSGAWYFDSKSHWNECSRCGEKKNEEAHVPGKEATEESPQMCKVCSYVIAEALSHKHSYTGKWMSSDEGHYKECECSQRGDLLPHEWDNGTLTKFPTEDTPGVITYKCDICARKRTEYVEDITDIIEPDNNENSGTNDTDNLTDENTPVREKDISPNSGDGSDLSLALSIGALVIGFLNLVMFAVIIVILLKKNENGRKK